MLRVVIDTNLWISFLITKKYKSLDMLLNANRIKLVFSIELLTEFVEVVRRPRLRKYFSDSDLETLLNLFAVYGEFVEQKSTVHICRDDKDNFLLSLAKDSNANYLVTGDDDLLVIKKFGFTKIVTYRELRTELDF